MRPLTRQAGVDIFAPTASNLVTSLGIVAVFTKALEIAEIEEQLQISPVCYHMVHNFGRSASALYAYRVSPQTGRFQSCARVTPSG